MTHTECIQLQRKARRSGRLHGNVLMLLAEICEAHTLDKGCIVENETFADRLNCTARTVRNWLRQLKQMGLVSESKEAGNRVLCPRVPSWMEWKERSTAERTFQNDTDISGKSVPERKERSETGGNQGGKSFPTQRDNNSESACSAHAHGDRWAFLPRHYQSLLPDIRAEAGTEEHPPDLLDVAHRWLRPDPGEDLSATVDRHRNLRSDDQIIAAYVVAGDRADTNPVGYADQIIREGWKRSAGDGAPVSLTDENGHEPNVIRFSDR